MQLAIALITMVISVSSSDSHGASFGEYHPHTQWIDIETHSIVVDAYVDRLVISQKGAPSITIRGIWQGRAFLKQGASPSDKVFFSVAYEGTRAGFSGEARFGKLTLARVRPDPR